MSPSLIVLGSFISKMTIIICISKLTNMAMQPLQLKLDHKLQYMKKELEQQQNNKIIEIEER